MIRLETLIELKFLNSIYFRAYPLIEIGQAIPCRAIRGISISVSSTLPPSYILAALDARDLSSAGLQITKLSMIYQINETIQHIRSKLIHTHRNNKQ